MAREHSNTLPFLPVALNVRDRRCVVVGGGAVGTRKASTLARAGAIVTVVSPTVTGELARDIEAGRIHWVKNAFRNEHLGNDFLVVAATGTGKTVIAAFDFKQFQRQHTHCRMLFVVHREEILHQARAVFRNILRDQNFGELWVGTNRPDHLEQLFISVQTFRSQKLWQRLAAEFYDYIVIDETHHAPAGSYSELTSYFTPQVLLGLTATPERADGEDILKYFDHRICAEIRLPDAINRKLLSPFQYFCITDCVDYSKLTWQRGRYVQKEMDNLITGNLFIMFI